MEEIHLTTHDEYGMKAGGVLTSLHSFQTYFGLELGLGPQSHCPEAYRLLICHSMRCCQL